VDYQLGIYDTLKNRMSHMKISLKGFTVMEMLIIISVIIILAVAFITLADPLGQFNKGYDSKRKHDMGQLSKLMDDFYNDYGAYPDDSQICYGSASDDGNNVCSCYICGEESTSADFSPYLRKLPCDPHHPSKRFLYQYDCTSGKWYRLYAALSDSLGSYNYAVTSSNTTAGIYPTIAPLPTSAPDVCQPAIYCYVDEEGTDCQTCWGSEGNNDCNIGSCYELIFYDNTSGGLCENECLLPTPTP
jgi:type II secretory pathway pseudopilin PulG